MASLNAAHLRELTEDGLIFNIDSDHVKDCHSGSDEEEGAQLQEHCNKECVGIFDEDIYEEGGPFDIISKRMDNMLPNGKIKKRIIREGDGEQPTEFATVKIHYNAYLEYNEEPFDSTYARHKPLRFVVNDGRVLPGLDFAVQSMKLNEKSQFLVDPEYAYGKCLIGSRVPSDSTILFEVELVEVVNSGATVTFEKLSKEEQYKFSEVYKYCLALCEKAKQLFSEEDLKNAIKNYNMAVTKWERVILSNKDEIEKQRLLSLKLYSNLLVCYTRVKEPKKGCLNAKKIYDLTDNGELMKIPPKVYFNHAKCLRMLSEYSEARAVLDKARKIEPNNPEITKELLALENEKTEHESARMAFAKALVGTSRT